MFSLGIPTENYSFSGALKTGSKVILILVMLRGRHRDLPMSIDRASEHCRSGLAGSVTDALLPVLLPEEFSQVQPDAKGRHIMREEVAERLEREASLMSEDDEPPDVARRHNHARSD